MIVLTRADVEALLDLDELVDAVGGALADLSAGRASMPPRIAALVPEVQGLLGTMPAYLPGASLAVKLVTLFPQNRDRHTHQAAIMVFDHGNGTPTAPEAAHYRKYFPNNVPQASWSFPATNRLLLEAGVSARIFIWTFIATRMRKLLAICSRIVEPLAP